MENKVVSNENRIYKSVEAFVSQKYGKFYQAYASNFSTVVSDDVMVKFSAAN